MSSPVVKLAPSILAADFARLGEQVREAEAAGADRIHVDVMDGHFVPNLTMGPCVVKSLRPVTRLPLEVHLMVEEPDRFLEAFADAGADGMIVHVENAVNLHRTVHHVKKLGKRVGRDDQPGHVGGDVGGDSAGYRSDIGDDGESRFRRPALHRQHARQNPPRAADDRRTRRRTSSWRWTAASTRRRRRRWLRRGRGCWWRGRRCSAHRDGVAAAMGRLREAAKV